MCHNHYKENFNGWYSQPVRWYRISGRVVQLNRAVCHERPLFTGMEIDMAKISIIVPVYNAEDFLPVCLSSIKDQTYTDFEVIMVD